MRAVGRRFIGLVLSWTGGVDGAADARVDGEGGCCGGTGDGTVPLRRAGGEAQAARGGPAAGARRGGGEDLLAQGDHGRDVLRAGSPGDGGRHGHRHRDPQRGSDGAHGGPGGRLAPAQPPGGGDGGQQVRQEHRVPRVEVRGVAGARPGDEQRVPGPDLPRRGPPRAEHLVDEGRDRRARDAVAQAQHEVQRRLAGEEHRRDGRPGGLAAPGRQPAERDDHQTRGRAAAAAGGRGRRARGPRCRARPRPRRARAAAAPARHARRGGTVGRRAHRGRRHAVRLGGPADRVDRLGRRPSQRRVPARATAVPGVSPRRDGDVNADSHHVRDRR